MLKIMAGILYGWIGIYYGKMAQVVDTWGFHYYSLQDYKLLYTNPDIYFTNIFYNPYDDGFYTFFSSDHSFWLNLQGNAMIKVLSIFDIFSFGNYYVNIIFYDFLTLFGSIGIYRVMSDVFPGKKIQLILSVFFIPSFLFWTNGIHKEGFIFTGISMLIFCTYFSLAQRKLSLKRIFYFLIGILLIFTFRSFLLFTIIPALITWIASANLRANPLKIFLIIYLAFFTLFFTLRYISPKLDFPEIVVKKQKDFLRLQGGNSQVSVQPMNPEVISFISAVPHALMTSTLRPFPADAKNILSLAAAIEINSLIILAILFLFYRIKRPSNYPFLYFCIFFSLTTLIIIGYTANFLGAIVRYRSIIIPFLIIPMIALTDWSRIGKLLFARSKS
ncbi:MAG: hypothetical protein ABUT20_57095 [Bacteroidota bacterium]